MDSADKGRLDRGPALAAESGQLIPDSAEALIGSLSLMIELRDRLTGQHCRQVGRIGEAIASRLGLDRQLVCRVGLVGAVHDLGKIAMPDRVLHNSDDLSERELVIMRAHAIDGERILLSLAPLVPAMVQVAAAVVAHHERWNGTGYPRGLVGAAIPIEARIVAVADAYSAITMERSYQLAKEHAHAVCLVETGAGIHFDPAVVEAFLAIEREGQL